MLRYFWLSILALTVGNAANAQESTKPLKLLFLGDTGHHRPAERFRQLQPVLEKRGIQLTYTEKVEALDPKILNSYDGLIVYANLEKLAPEQEKALLDYVESGKGFIPIHCASYCFLNSQAYIDLVGAQFQSHKTGTFRTMLAEPNHPIMKGFAGFESWDETYVHTKHNDKNRVVLEYRQEKNKNEPWTWVRTQGKGRVFYTAWGHDERTWGHEGFVNLIERGIRWSVGSDSTSIPSYTDRPKMTTIASDAPGFEYLDVGNKIPDYKQGTGKTLNLMQKPLAPVDSMKHIINPVDFELKLFATEEQFGGKPICMNWDERGRLWAAITVDYPNQLKPAGEGRDRIVILEDTDGDGRADKMTVFADKLSIPTSLIFANGGIIVQQAPHTLFLRDNKGTGVADERRILFTGWSTNDSHAGPSNLAYGLDNWIYGSVGYAGFNGEVGGEKLRFSQGFYRFKPDGSKLEFLRSTSNNTWGLGFSEEGDLFGSTANGNPSVHLPIPNRYYEAVRGWSSTVLPMISNNDRFYPITEKVRQVDHHGGFTAAAGHALYTARTYPKQYWNRTAFVTEPTGHLVATFVIEPNGGSFRTRNTWNLFAGADEWVAPIMAEVGPDGNVWIIDWYAYIVQHNPTPPGFKNGRGNAYETDLRDTTKGRIYRLVSHAAKVGEPISLQGASPEKLVATLKNDNFLWRKHAQRLLVERGKLDVVPGLIELVNDTKVDAIGLNPGAIHALWTLQGLGARDAKSASAAITALKHPSAGVRRNAVQVLLQNPDTIDTILTAGLLKDADPQVRLKTLLVLAELPGSTKVAEALVALLDDDMLLQDRPSIDALTAASARHANEFLQQLALKWTKPLESTRVDLVQRIAEHVGRGGQSEEIEPLFEALASAQGAVAEPVIIGLEKGWPRSKTPTLTEKTEKRFETMLEKLSPTGRGRLVTLAQIWGSKNLERYASQIVANFLTELNDKSAPDVKRIQAAMQLIEFRRSDTDTAQQLLKLLVPGISPEFAQGLLEALSKSDAKEVGPALVEMVPSLTPTVKGSCIRILLSRVDWTTTFLGSLEAGKLQITELSLDQRQGLASHPQAALAKRARSILAKGNSLPNPDRQKVIDELLPITKQVGDATAGKLVFKTHCSKCHIHSGEGAKIGPDLTGMAVHPKTHLLTEIMDPSRSVEGNYRQYVVTTNAGRILSGLLASENKTAIEVIDAEAKKIAILREDIDEIKVSPKSLMPEGFEKQLKQEELVNLLEFMTQRGRFLPLPLDKVASAVSTRGMFYGSENPTERLIFADWSPKTFQGVPFHLVDPQGDKVPNVILFYGPEGTIPPKMPKSVRLECNGPAKAIHLLSGVSGWGYPYGSDQDKGSLTLTVMLHYADGKTESHALKNGVHFADYIGHADVPESKLAFDLKGRQIRYLSIEPLRQESISAIEFIKGTDRTAPVIMAVTVENLK